MMDYINVSPKANE